MTPFLTLNFDITFEIMYKTLQTEGFLAYEYNPFRNLRLSGNRYLKATDGRYVIKSGDIEIPATLKIIEPIDNDTGIFKEKEIYITDQNIDTLFIISSNNSNINTDEVKSRFSEATAEYSSLKYTPRQALSPREWVRTNSKKEIEVGNPGNNEGRLITSNRKGDLVDFSTKDLNFSINNPVDIEIQESYDGSVNLILNDDLNPPRLINSRFTPTENGMYKIIDRNGNNDTNIYDENSLDGETKLYKTIKTLPVIRFDGVESGGELKVGNYVFYFKYQDSDGNETDFVAESGIVSVYIGDISDIKTIKGGILDTNAYKTIRFTITNIDDSYDYLNIYYTRSTSTENGTEITKAYKLVNSFSVINTVCTVTITGIEPVSEISLDDINIQYSIVENAKSQAQVQNRLFLSNVNKTTIPYKELADLSLRIIPEVYTEDEVGDISLDNGYYTPVGSSRETFGMYYNVYNIYHRVGYWEDIYRFGIVYIMNDFTLSPVFNIRGRNLGIENTEKIESIYNWNKDTELPGDRNYIEVLENGFIKSSLDNAKGVVKLSIEKNSTYDGYNKPVGIKFIFKNSENNSDYPTWKDTENLIKELKKYTKGFFFVRQKRIPTVYCQGATIGLDLNSKIPVLPVKRGDGKPLGMTESFIANSNGDSILENDINNRLLYSNDTLPNAAIVPEAELNNELYSQIFNGSKFVLRDSYLTYDTTENYITQRGDDRHYTFPNFSRNKEGNSSRSWYQNISLTYIDDNIQLKTSGTQDFSSRAGEAEVAYKFKYLGKEDNKAKAKNLLRGSWGSYVGIEGLQSYCKLVDIMVPGYNEGMLVDYFKARFSDMSPYYSICDRYEWDSLEGEELVCYRGDCYINIFTHRMCRNFQDPESPTNDTIVDPYTWRDNYTGSEEGALDLEKAELINRGDVNAVQIGHWVTLKCLSNINLALRCEDGSNTSEAALNGHPRTFYPISRFNASGEYKIPESTVYNSGYNSSTSDKNYFILPDVPYIKNDFSNRIMYSDIFISDAFKNNYRVFQLSNYRDYNKEYGTITSIIEWYGDLVVVFEKGVGLIPINERIQTAGELNNPVYLNSNNVLPERPILLSKLYGSQWKDSILKTDNYVYGVDTFAKKIWRTNGKSFEIISDFKIQKYLNDNISFTERERSTTLGLRNVKTHFNKFKFDVLFTFYDDIQDINPVGEFITSREWNLCYNEKLQLWTTRYSWIPLMSENISNVFFTNNKEDSKNISKVSVTWEGSVAAKGIILRDPTTYLNKVSWESILNPINNPLVVYKGIEIPDLTSPVTTGKDVAVGLLDIKLDVDPDKFRIKYSKYEFINNDIYPDNEDFYLYTHEDKIGNKVSNRQTWLILRSSNSTIRNKYLEGNKYVTLNIRAELVRGRNESITSNMEELEVDASSTYTGVVYIRTSSETWKNPTYFWRHGVAGIFDNKEKIYPTSWYKERDSKGVPLSYDPFEFEFVVNKNVGYHKVFTNLFIISNNVLPELVSFEVIGDAYDFSNIPDLKENTYLVQKGEIEESEADDYIKFIDNKDCNNKSTGKSAIVFYDDRLSEYSLRRIQPIKDMSTCGIIKGNTRYQEDFVNITLEPFKYQKGNKGNIKLKIEETRPRDKYIKIRVKYKGDKRVIITALQTMFEISFC